MSFAVMPISDYVGACNVIREKTGSSDAVKSGEMADKIKAVYEAGKTVGGDTEAAYERGLAEGREAEHMAFWNIFTNNGKRTNYNNAFYCDHDAVAWTAQNFKPPYKLTPTKCSQMFSYFSWQIKPVAGITPDIVDFSQCTEANRTFRNAHIAPLVVDFSSLTKMEGTFMTDNGGYMTDTTIKVTENLKSESQAFLHHSYGVTFTDDSVIACSMSFSYSTRMTVAQAKSIINALKDFSGTDKEFTCKVTFPSAVKTLLENEGTTSPNGNTWLDYVDDKGWLS